MTQKRRPWRPGAVTSTNSGSEPRLTSASNGVAWLLPRKVTFAPGIRDRLASVTRDESRPAGAEDAAGAVAARVAAPPADVTCAPSRTAASAINEVASTPSAANAPTRTRLTVRWTTVAGGVVAAGPSTIGTTTE